MKIYSKSRVGLLLLFFLMAFSGCGKGTAPAPLNTNPALNVDQKKCLRVFWVADPAEAQAVQQSLDSGEDFVELARTRSRANPDKVMDHTYCLKPVDMEPGLRKAALELNPGEMKGPLSLNQGQAWIRATTDKYFRQAGALFRQNRFKEAQEALAGDLELNPDHIAGWRLLSVIKVGERDWPGALEAVDKALYWTPLDPVLISNRASFLWKMGKKKEAVRSYEKALGLDPTNPKMLNNLAWALAAQQSDLKRAESLAHRATVLSPYESNLWNTLGLIQKLRGSHAEAVVSLQKALQLGGKNPETRKWLLESFLSLKREDLVALEEYLLVREPALVGSKTTLKPEKVSASRKKDPSLFQKPDKRQEIPISEQDISAPPPWILAKGTNEGGGLAAPRVNKPVKKAEPKTKSDFPGTKPVIFKDASKPSENAKKKASQKAALHNRTAPKTSEDTPKISGFRVASLPGKPSQKASPDKEPVQPSLAPDTKKAPQPNQNVFAASKDQPRDLSPKKQEKTPRIRVAFPTDSSKSGQTKVFKAPLDQDRLPEKPTSESVRSREEQQKVHAPYLQIASFRSLTDALSARRVWQRKGADCFLEHLDLGSRGKWYRILLGPFTSYEKARDQGRKLQKRGEIKTFMVVEK